MKVIEVRDETGLRGLRSAWQSLLETSASSTIFLSWEWTAAWWSAYGNEGSMRLLAAYGDDGELLGLAPLRAEAVSRYGQKVDVLRFLADGSNDSDYLDFIAAAGREAEVLKAFVSHLRSDLDRGVVLMLNEIPETSPNYPLLHQLATERNSVRIEEDVPCATVRLPATWDEYLKLLKPRFRTKVRSVLRNLEERSEVRFGSCETMEEVERLLPVLYDLHARRWESDGKPGVFVWDRKRRFYEALSPLLLEQGRLRFTWLEWNGHVLACQYGFEYGGVYFQLQEGYEPEAEALNAGVGLRAWSIRKLIGEGVTEYDSMAGVSRHKTDWGGTVKHSKRLLMASPTWKNLLFCRGPEWEERAKHAIKDLVPEKVLALRQARNGAGTNGGSSKEWVREAAANCYYHLKLPKLVRPLRERYQFSAEPNRGGRKVLSRRTETAARILCYHRINNENDPFFPAISTDQFEWEMRYLAHHYKVVSLPKLMQHLEDAGGGTVMAVTFDDGYGDNYENALPILQLYGLPATVFLTTGSLDSRDPLWFEQIALAVKKTALEYLDLEIGFPRRFSLRTEADRLETNQRVFGLLRAMPDGERRDWVERILRELAVANAGERRNRMLTWDQVRTMKAQGIEFGGHTVSHPFISRLSPEQSAWEVGECKRRIEEELQSPVSYFAYPNGREEDFGNWNKSVVRNAGYRAALTTIWGVNYKGTDPMELRRGGPWEPNPAMFAYKLDWYQLVND